MIRVLIVLAAVCSAVAVLPSGLKRCTKVNPEHSECIKNNIQTALALLGKGIPELNIGSFEPFPIKHLPLVFDQGFSLIMDNGSVEGFTKPKIIEVESIPWEKLYIKSYSNYSTFRFNYTASGLLFNIRIKSSGFGMMRIEQNTRDLNISFSEYKKDGKTYLKVKDMHVLEVPKGFKAEFFPRGKSDVYRTMINKIINDNWRVLHEEHVRSGMEGERLFYTAILDGFLTKIPMEDFDSPA